ncbi:MAG: leucine-rich repeat protein, partial [Lachnospiraceae bacterium]|nr:leucine-rich repeat protein [Lachnospiraceae bacterium]
MAKGITKKNNRRLKRQIRKTVGGLLMASAIVVAALPVPDVSANPEVNASAKIKVAVLDSQQSKEGSSSPFKKATSPYTSKIPHACERTDEEQIVYTSGDGTYQFVYMRPTTNDTNKVAVILGYNSGPLQDSTLTIPETLKAYRKYTDNVTSRGYCLVSKSDEFLHYETLVQKKDENDRKLYKVINFYDDENHEALQVNQDELYLMEDGTWQYRVANGYEQDEEGNDTSQVHYDYYKVDPIMEPQYNPCYYEQKDQWENISDKDLYYSPDNNGQISKDDEGNTIYIKAGDDSNHWKINADVAYIGAEKITDNNGIWSLAGDITSPSEGVFAEENNITNLIVGENIRGISDYAFYGCSTLKSVTLANGLDTIGNGAFANCINMESCNIASNANIVAIGKDAFYNCRALSSFTVPIGLRALGDNCFEGCSALTSVSFGNGSSNVALEELGYHLFKNCRSLGFIEFPSTYEENDLDIDMFEGCSSLQYVKVPNDKINIGEFHNGTGDYPNCGFEWESTKESDGTITKIGFKDTVPDSFYFEGPASSDIHDTATENSVAFKYLNQDLYEKIEYEHDAVKDASNPNGKSAKVTYQVNSNNELVKFWINSGDKPDNVTIPETIGPYGISSIREGSFTNNCDLIRLTIPASVNAIGDNAFKGCHNLETVIFTDATTIQSIGSNAFKTQDASCGDTLYPNGGVSKPELTFVGAMMNDAGADTIPFIYAMNGVSNINNANQEKIWITCHSGWPTNLEVQYNYDPISNTGEAQLIGYPRYEMIKDLGSATEWVSNLPYVTDQNKQEYLSMVTKATEYYQATDDEKKDMTQPTENEMAIVNSTLNVVIPTSVDSIKPGLFSGYVENDEGTGWEKVNNIKETSGESTLTEKSKPDTYIQRVVLNGVNEIEPYTFKNCTSLTEASIIGPIYIDDYAFDGLDDDESVQFESGVPTTMQLQTVTLGTNLTDTGKRPFRGCEKLTAVNCLDSDFAYNNGIIYRNTGSGTEIVECLESRGAVGGIGSYSVGPDELAGVTTIKEEAFADCDDVGKVDLSATTIDAIPEGCFKETDDLNSVVLPDTVKNIEADSFINSGIRLLTIPGSQAYIARDAFKNDDKQQTIIFECIEGTTADRYAKAEENWYINPEYGKVYLEHMVYFWDYPDYPDTSNKELFYKVKVKDGEDAVPP